MHKALIALVMVAGLLVACNKTPKSSDPFEQKLQESAGSGSAANCGRLQQQQADLKKASDCVMQAAQAKKPFYVAYDMPGLSVGVAGNSEGKLFAVQSQAGAEGKPAITAEPCPAELRVAQSGRMTCMPMGTMGMGGENPHGGMAMPMPPGGEAPHGGMAMPPMGTPNPHAGGAGPASDHGGQQPAAKPKN